MVKLAEAFKIEVYELIKPEKASSPKNNANLTKFTEEIIDILSKNLKIAEKNVSLSLTTLQDKYLTK